MNIVPANITYAAGFNLKLLIIPILLTLSLGLCVLLSRIDYFRNQKESVDTKRTATDGRKALAAAGAREKEDASRAEIYLNELSNATKKLIAMERKAKRLEENIKRVKESTINLLWRNKDKALWCILFKNVSCDVVIRHELHEHSGLKRILSDSRSWRHQKHRLFKIKGV